MKHFSLSRNLILFSIAAGAALTIQLTGCSPSQGELEKRKAAAVTRIEDTFRSAQALQFEGKTAEAEKLVLTLSGDQAIQRYALNELNVNLFRFWIDQGSPATAWKILRDIAAVNDAAVTLPLRDQLYHAFRARETNAATCTAWCRDVLKDSRLSPDPETIYAWMIATAIEAKKTELRSETFQFLLEQPQTDLVAASFKRVLEQCCQDRKSADAMEALATLAQQKAPDRNPFYAKLAVTTSITHYTATLNDEALIAIIPDASATLADDELLPLLRKALTELKKARSSKLGACAESCVTLAKTHPKTADFAAGIWLEERLKANPDAIAAALDTLQARGISPTMLADLFSRYFYDYIEKPAIVKQLCEFALRLNPTITDEAVLSYFRSMILDAAFMIKDYPLCFAMLDSGIPKQPPEWHAMIRCKIKAHEALDAANPDAAAKALREFMTYIEKGEEETYDPALQIAFPKATVLGRNTRRIADIYTQAGKTEEAAAARAETLKYFEQAVEKAVGEKAKTATREELKAFKATIN